MKIDEKALDEAVHWYWKHGAISSNVPRGCIETYLKAAKAVEQPGELPERDKTKPAEEQGVFRKFDVDQPGDGK